MRPLEVQAHWSSIRLFIEPSLKAIRSPHTLGSLLREILDGDAFCWVALHDGEITGTMVAAVEEWPSQGRIVVGRVAGGRDVEAWGRQMVAEICAWGRANGCKVAMVPGRKGWSRLLGAKIESYCMMLEL